MIDPNYLISCMFKTALQDKSYLIIITSVFDPEYFVDAHISEIYKYMKKHFAEYKNIPSKEIIINSVPADIKESVEYFLNELDTFEYDIAKNYDWLFTETNNYLKDKAIKQAVMASVDIIDSGDNIQGIRKLIEDALCKDLKIDIGLDYWNDLNRRLTEVFNASEKKIPTYYPMFDDYISGGFPPFTLSILCAKVHGGKSNIMANMIARQVLNGHNVGLCSLEMSEKMFSQRFDSIYSLLDINRMYVNTDMKKILVTKLHEIKKTPNRGNLFIKNFPTGNASVADFRMWIRELSMRGNNPDILYCDYINLMRPEYKNTGSLYADVKKIAEELRALGLEFGIPIVSVSQINRAGTFLSFGELDMNSIAESFGVAATADLLAIVGGDEESMVYQSELSYKLVKNRLGRPGVIGKWYVDDRSLKLYCETESKLWISDANITGDERNLYSKKNKS